MAGDSWHATAARNGRAGMDSREGLHPLPSKKNRRETRARVIIPEKYFHPKTSRWQYPPYALKRKGLAKRIRASKK